MARASVRLPRWCRSVALVGRSPARPRYAVKQTSELPTETCLYAHCSWV